MLSQYTFIDLDESCQHYEEALCKAEERRMANSFRAVPGKRVLARVLQALLAFL